MSKTIVALATPPGTSGIAVVRLSGSRSVEIADMHFSGKKKINESASHTIHYGKFISEGMIVDTVTINLFKSPNSYTGEDVVEPTVLHQEFDHRHDIRCFLHLVDEDEGVAGDHVGLGE